ncbi:MAG: UbiD family decarboxylase [Candidatus Limnocylindria bacterium]
MAPARWRDLRDWMERVDALGELRVIRGASWQADIGAITEMLDHEEGSPTVVFDDIPGYPSGRRVIVNCNGTPTRQAVTLGLPLEQGTHDGLFRFWRTTLDELRPVPPREVADGPVFENVVEGDRIDLESFPAPVWHANDGGRFIGTASLNILRDPDSDWVNVASYRNQIFGKDTLGIWISPGKHGRFIREKYFDRGMPCPVVVVVGSDPLLFMSACAEGLAYGQAELAWAGGVRGEAVDVVRGRHTGLPIPARAEIAIEGFIDPKERHAEGPYGEWMGYYASGETVTPVIRVKAIYHRNDPIILGCPQGKPPHEDNRFLAYLRSALIEKQMRAAGVPKVRGVWAPPQAGNRLMTIVAIEQAFAGHATQAALVAGQVGAAAYGGRFVIVVDEDIDIYDMDDVLWAITTRCDPERDISTTTRAWSGPLDPAIHPDHRGFNSRCIIDATKPWEWKDRFAEPVVTSEQARATRQRWGWILRGEPDPRGVRP